MSPCKVQLNSIVAKSNELVPKLARYDLQELRLIAFCLAHYDSRKPENKRFTARVEDLAKIFPSMDEKSAYDVIEKSVDEINRKPIKFRDDDGRFYSVWFSGFKYREKEGVFEFAISQLLEPYLLELKERFSMYRLGDVHQFRAASSWKLYEHLNAHKYSGAWHVSIDDLKMVFGAEEKHDRFDSLRQRLIDPAVAEISEKSNLAISYVKERAGRKVASLRFFIETKDKDYVSTPENQKNMLLRLMLEYDIKYSVAETLISKIADLAKEQHFLKKLPEMVSRWTEAKGPLPRYVTGAVKKELGQLRLDSRPYAEALGCWTVKKQAKEQCKVRVRGTAGNRHKCKMCLLHISPETFGI